jgi:transcriptional regulator with PAS, ATPase and Fis domain
MMSRRSLQPYVRDRGELITKSPGMGRLLELADRAAASEATVLITGESGTGKERVARYIHGRSRRGGGAFLAINCGGLPETLLESELFGHRKGSFTGATADKKGLFEAAAGGTLFLDEVGETSPAVQVPLLRALQEHSVRPVGATADIPVDVRIIAATNRDLDAMVREHAFRTDLFYRLRVLPLEVPPLRERKEDLLALARQFIARACAEYSCGPCTLSPEALDLFLAYDWPGNVRELENAIERAVVLADGKPRIDPADLPAEIRGHSTLPATPSGAVLTLAEVERQHILAMLNHFGGNRKATARALGVGANSLWRKLKRYGVQSPRTSRRSKV